jgi:hypothetical protein
MEYTSTRLQETLTCRLDLGGREMTNEERVFVIQQIGAKDSPERKRADEIYEGIIVPAVEHAGLAPYRADLDLTPGAITSKMLAELLGARVVIADLTGRNPNVFYELGITHSFARPLISIADSSKSLPFDAKDERIIELGEYPPNGLGLIQGQKAINLLRESLRIVLDDNYAPATPLREVAANRSVDQLAPENPLAAEMAQMRETLEEIRSKIIPRSFIPQSVKEDISILRGLLLDNISHLTPWDIESLTNEKTSKDQQAWTKTIREKWESSQQSKRSKPEDTDPWTSDSNAGGYSDEPPF